jgi:hypothetical protein
LSGPPGAIEFRNRREMPMAARKKKAGSRRPAVKKRAAKSAKSRVVAKKKAAKAPKRRVAAKKPVRAAKKRVATKKPVAVPRPAMAPPAPTPPSVPAAAPVAVTELDNRIAIVRANLRELVDQAASSAGAANEELLSQRIAEQEERLRRLRQEREQISEEPE